jgi:molybdate transport system substrate-binding protein
MHAVPEFIRVCRARLSRQNNGRKVVTKRIVHVAAVATILFAQVTLGAAAELKVYSTIGVQGAVEQLAPQFEKASGHKLAITWGTAAMLVKRIEGGESADVLILTREGIGALTKEGKVAAGTDVTLASSGIAVAVKAGAAKPDISTPEALKQALLNAKAISYSDPAAGGASGVYFAKLLERMGIADQVKAKTKYPPPGGNSASLLMTGEAELAIQQKPEVMYVAGAEVIGLLPADLNNVTVFAAGIAADSKNADAGKALIKMLHSPEATAVFRAKGLDPS